MDKGVGKHQKVRPAPFKTEIWHDVLPPLEAKAKAEALVAQALKLDDTLPEAHTSLGYLKLSYDWDFAAAEKEFQRAIDLNPGYPTAHHWYAHYLLAQGQMDPALAEMKRAQELEPLSLILNTGVGWCLYYARKYDEAIEQFQNVFQMEPNFVPAQYALAMTYMQKGSTREAIAEWQKLNTAYAGRVPLPLSGLGVAQANAGNRREAQNALNQLRALSAQRYVPALYPALIHSALHDDKQALIWAQKALAERPEYLIYVRVEPAFERLRADPQFQKLARQGARTISGSRVALVPRRPALSPSPYGRVLIPPCIPHRSGQLVRSPATASERMRLLSRFGMPLKSSQAGAESSMPGQVPH